MLLQRDYRRKLVYEYRSKNPSRNRLQEPTCKLRCTRLLHFLAGIVHMLLHSGHRSKQEGVMEVLVLAQVEVMLLIVLLLLLLQPPVVFSPLQPPVVALLEE